jgi:glycosyltransferase involved in cell wall biosynthesis
VAARVRVALVHEWLLTHGGSEEITGQLCALFPDADLFTLVSNPVPSLRALIGERRIITSWLQRIPGATRHHRKLLPLMPRAIESFDFTGYDLVISVSHAVAKGVRTAAPTVHLNICCSPVRYAWDLQEQYLEESGLSRGVKGFAARRLLAGIRAWDKRSANRPTEILAISAFIAERIERVWGRSSSVLYPPVDTEYFAARNASADGDSAPERESDLYVTASRFVPYKRIPLIVDAFARMPTRRLVVIGDGPEMEKARALATSNVTLMGHLPRAELRAWLQRARGFVFAAEEDFGIAPVEALAAGTPVVAFGRGGARETVGAGSGVFFEHQTTESIVDAVQRLEEAQERGEVTGDACVAQASHFSGAVFRAGVRAHVHRLVLPG